MEGQTKRKKVLLIHNPVAGKHNTKQDIWDVADYLFSSGCDVDIHVTRKAGDAYDFVREFGGDSDLLISCGGDGTVNEVVSSMAASCIQAPLCHLPLGTANDMAKTLNLPGSLRDVVALSESSDPIPMDAGMMNDEHLFTYVAAFGAFTDVAYQTTQELKNRFGYNAYLINGVRALHDLRPYEATVITDNSAYTGKFIYGSMSNSASIGGVIHLKDSQMSLTDGKFEVLLIRYPETAAEWVRAIKGIVTSHFDGEQLILETTEQATFTFSEPVAWTLDGEGAGSFEVVETGVMQHAYNMYGNLTDARQEASRKEKKSRALVPNLTAEPIY